MPLLFRIVAALVAVFEQTPFQAESFDPQTRLQIGAAQQLLDVLGGAGHVAAASQGEGDLIRQGSTVRILLEPLAPQLEGTGGMACLDKGPNLVNESGRVLA